MRDFENKYLHSADIEEYNCGGCMWFEQCIIDEDDLNVGCGYISPVGEMYMDDEYIDRIIEDSGIEYRREWERYVGEDNEERRYHICP